MNSRALRWTAALACTWIAAGCDEQEDPTEPASSCGYEASSLTQQDICALLGEACSGVVPSSVQMSDPVQIVPSEAMPREVESQGAHNNLDIVWHRGRLFFAFRTAPNHFASWLTELYVVSTQDQKHWTFEARFAMETDLREPRFVSVGDRLHLYFAVLGDNSLMFEPKETMVSEYGGPCAWSEPEATFEPKFIPWRVKVIEGEAYMLGYVGGDSIYDAQGGAIRVHWLRSKDGRTWNPVVTGQPVVLEGGVSETDFAFLDDGSVVAVGRNEKGDEDGFGSKICRAEASDLGSWTCVSDAKKYDSPLVFRHGGQVYLIGRRNMTDTGNFDLGMDDLPPDEQTIQYQIDYWVKPKRCALWRIDPQALRAEWVADLPSRGDTCFASAIALNAHEHLVYNYTSPLDGPDVGWNEGQHGPTLIYSLTLRLP